MAAGSYFIISYDYENHLFHHTIQYVDPEMMNENPNKRYWYLDIQWEDKSVDNKIQKVGDIQEALDKFLDSASRDELIDPLNIAIWLQTTFSATLDAEFKTISKAN